MTSPKSPRAAWRGSGRTVLVGVRVGETLEEVLERDHPNLSEDAYVIAFIEADPETLRTCP